MAILATIKNNGNLVQGQSVDPNLWHICRHCHKVRREGCIEVIGRSLNLLSHCAIDAIASFANEKPASIDFQQIYWTSHPENHHYLITELPLSMGPMPSILRYSENTMGSILMLDLRIASGCLRM